MVKDHSDIGGGDRLAARDVLCSPFYRHNTTYYGFCYTSCGALAGMRNSSMDPPREIDPTTNHITSGCSTAVLRLVASLHPVRYGTQLTTY